MDTTTSNKGRFKPGQSGNPGGRPKTAPGLAELCRKHTKEAIESILDIMRNGDSSSAKLAAAKLLLERGYGKAAESHQHIEREKDPDPFGFGSL